MSVLLAGGAGFIGSHTAVELLNAGIDVVVADDLSNSQPQVLDNIKKITDKEFKFYRIDISDTEKLDKIFTDSDIDTIIHFAGFKSVGESVEKPLEYYRNNLGTTLSLLEVMRAHKCRNFIFSSSATVYGDSEDVPFNENSPTGHGITNPYGQTKYMIEQILTDASLADKDMSVVLLRYFNPIGAHESGLIGERPSGVPNNLMPYITQTAAGIRDRLTIFGNDYPTPDGTGVRDYIHVVDLARGHLSAAVYVRNHRGVDIFNLGTGRGYSVMELVKTFERVNDVRVPYVIGGRREGDIAICYADTKKAESVMGWQAKKNIDDMCRDSWKWECNCRSEEFK